MVDKLYLHIKNCVMIRRRAREAGIQESDIRGKNSCFCYRAVGPRVSHISQTFGVFTVETKILHFSKLHFFYNFYYNLLTQ